MKNSKHKKMAVPSAADAALAALRKQQAEQAKNSGNIPDAYKLYCEALSLDSSLADVHFTLAMMARSPNDFKIDMRAVNKNIKNRLLLRKSYEVITTLLKDRKQYREAVLCYEEIASLFPDNWDEQVNLAINLNITEQKERAIKIMADAVVKNPTNKIYKGIFINICGPVAFKEFTPNIKKALQICFSNIYEANLRKAYSPWINIILHDPKCQGIRDAEKIQSDAHFDVWINDTAKNKDFLTDSFFLDGLRLLILSDSVLERFLVRMRKWLCLNIEKLQTENKASFYALFIFALAEHCFFNEYIFPVTANELSEIEKFKEKITLNNTKHATILLGLIGCYEPLGRNFSSRTEEINNIAAEIDGFRSLVKTQLLDPQTEESLKPGIRAFGKMENDISRKVRSQYEENPYPRWVSITNFPTPNDDIPMPESQRGNPWRILIAGCGTGRQAIGSAATYPNATVTAIDLSKASIAYGIRKARESGLANRIEFIHADILDMAQWPEQFDIIECSGVLHHMEDPMQGWRTLTNRLKDEGYFKVGLYSEIARRLIVQARNYVAEHNFPSTLEGIRTCRESILALPSSNPMRRYLITSGDFYTTSLLRDLIFHVQEHRMTLPQISGMLNQLGLRCTAFTIADAETVRRYDKMFPQESTRADLHNWAILEEKFPDTFAAMYQFWCRKSI